MQASYRASQYQETLRGHRTPQRLTSGLLGGPSAPGTAWIRSDREWQYTPGQAGRYTTRSRLRFRCRPQRIPLHKSSHSGQRVHLLQEASDRWTWNVGRRDHRKPKSASLSTLETIPVWVPASGSGALVTHNCVREIRGPASSQGVPERDRSLLETADH